MSDDPIRILVVDDDAATVDMVRLGLEADGMKVFSAFDGDEGIDLLARQRIDVVILDIMMPRVDGWMTLMDIRNNPATEDLPVIVLSAKSQERAKILAFRQGVQQYVTKPFSIAELSARAESLARGSRRMRGDEAGVSESDFRKLPVRKGGRTVLLTFDDVFFFSARNKSTYAHTHENQYLVDLTLGEIEDRFSREPYLRVHRSYLINIEKVREVLRVDGSYVAVIADRDETHVPVARRQVKRFREVVGI